MSEDLIQVPNRSQGASGGGPRGPTKILQNFTNLTNPVKTEECCRQLNVLHSICRLSYVFHMCSEWT